ncbi:hypothetical protein G9A89_008790 [Geosiphon pyriformis]|nr:hypothetical protein G9A89_008790 [Geosiphon pyriformis]
MEEEELITNELHSEPASTSTSPSKPPEISYEQHVAYFKMCLELLPEAYQSLDTLRMTLAYFCLSGLELLNALDTSFTKERRRGWIDWIYAQQILPDSNNPALNEKICGFRGSPFSGSHFDPNGTLSSRLPFDAANLAMTYTALCSLILLGDDLSRVDRKAIVNALRYLQNDDGRLWHSKSYTPTYQGMESDMRFLYCACAISYILNDFSGVNINSAIDYIRKSHVYDHGIGQGPNKESHGGSTYCAISSLYLLGRFNEGLLSKDETIFWLLSRQESGFQGRANKRPDSCYSFWIGASLKLLQVFELIDSESNRAFLIKTQTKYGGFAKWPADKNRLGEMTIYPPDPMHSYMGIAGLSLMGEPGILELDPAINISKRASERLINTSTRPLSESDLKFSESVMQL